MCTSHRQMQDSQTAAICHYQVDNDFFFPKLDLFLIDKHPTSSVSSSVRKGEQWIWMMEKKKRDLRYKQPRQVIQYSNSQPGKSSRYWKGFRKLLGILVHWSLPEKTDNLGYCLTRKEQITWIYPSHNLPGKPLNKEGKGVVLHTNLWETGLKSFVKRWNSLRSLT